jgi:tripartite-type tricarboxylate transporter receptor subunit TctC
MRKPPFGAFLRGRSGTDEGESVSARPASGNGGAPLIRTGAPLPILPRCDMVARPMIRLLTRRLKLVAASALMGALAAAPLRAADDDFYRGRTITIIIPIGPGGAYDAYARMVSRHLGKHLPGNPTLVARNMPGGGGVIASNHLYNLAPQDGTTLSVITSSFVNEQILDNPQIRYDARKFLAIGRLLDTTSVLFFWHASHIKTVDDMLTKPSTIAISSVNEVPAYRLRAMVKFLGAPFKTIPGYPSARDYVMAVERRETDGGTSTYIGLSQLFSNFLKEKKLNLLVQFALKRDPDMPDVPTVLELASDPQVRQIFGQLVSNDEIGRSLFTTPNVPPARLALLRFAFQTMIADPDFRAEAAQLKLPLVPKTGEEMQKVVADNFAISPEALATIRELSRP